MTQMPGQGPDGAVMHALDSGFPISSDGEIVTNNRIVEGATSIKVRLNGGSEMTAHVVGTDPMTNVALIKVERASGLPTVKPDESGKLREGDVAKTSEICVGAVDHGAGGWPSSN